MIRNLARQAGPLLLSLGLVFAVRTVLAEPYRVPSSSMVPTLLVGDQLIGEKFAYGFSKYSLPIGQLPDFAGRVLGQAPERGDVVVFRLPRDPDTTYVKRVIGLPGDRIQLRAGRLYINGEMAQRQALGPYADDSPGHAPEATLYDETLPGGRTHRIVEISDRDRYDDTPVYLVPERHYFMMGDNRDNSLDSRVAAERGGVGFVPEENIVARVDRLLVSYNPAVDWLDIADWGHAFRPGRALSRVD